MINIDQHLIASFLIKAIIHLANMGGTYWSDESLAFEYDEPASQMAEYNVFRLILCSTWLGAMFVIAVAYFHFSKKEKRRTRLFQLQGFCAILALLYNVSETGIALFRLNSFTYQADQNMDYRWYCAWRSAGYFAEHVIPILSDSALLFRVSCFYPTPVYSKNARLLILLPFWFLLASRSILSVLLTAFILAQWLSGMQSHPSDVMLLWDPPLWSYNGYSTATALEFSLASVYCIAVSALLLYKAYQLANSLFYVNNKQKVKGRMRFFAEALLMCCVPPIFFNIAVLIQLLAFYNSAYYRETATLLVNTTVIFSILATSWSNIRADWSNKQTHISTIENPVEISNFRSAFGEELKCKEKKTYHQHTFLIRK